MWSAWTQRAAAQSLIEGVDSWAEATANAATAKWGGQRVAFPQPTARPATAGRLDATAVPISVHLAAGVPLARGLAVLEAAEAAYTVLAATGWAEQFGDGGQGGTSSHDLYVVAQAAQGADAAIDATQPAWGLDGARAFALLDARIPQDHVEVCTAQALVEALLYELDPAEAASVRKSSAAYVASLITGQLGCDDDAEQRRAVPYVSVMGAEPRASGAAWLQALDARQDGGTGVFLSEMWHFARQRTWEGAGLRGSPDLFEVIAKALQRSHEQLEDVAAELADQSALAQVRDGGRLPGTELRWSTLPKRLAPTDPPLEPLGSSYAWVRTEGLVPHDRIRVWSRGEYGVRWALSVTQLDRDGHPRGRASAPPRKNPNSFVTLDLDPRTTAVLVSITNVGDGIPDADQAAPGDVRAVALIIDQGGAGDASGGEGEPTQAEAVPL